MTKLQLPFAIRKTNFEINCQSVEVAAAAADRWKRIFVPPRAPENVFLGIPRKNPPSAFIVLLVLHFGKLFLCNCFAGKTLTMLGLSLPLRWPLPRVFNLKQVRVSLELVVFEFLYGKRCQNYFISFIYSNSLILQFNFKLKYIRKFAGLSLSHFCVVTNCFLL